MDERQTRGDWLRNDCLSVKSIMKQDSDSALGMSLGWTFAKEARHKRSVSGTGQLGNVLHPLPPERLYLETDQ